MRKQTAKGSVPFHTNSTTALTLYIFLWYHVFVLWPVSSTVGPGNPMFTSLYLPTQRQDSYVQTKKGCSGGHEAVPVTKVCRGNTGQPFVNRTVSSELIAVIDVVDASRGPVISGWQYSCLKARIRTNGWLYMVGRLHPACKTQSAQVCIQRSIFSII
jgi:hypothetical protein